MKKSVIGLAAITALTSVGMPQVVICEEGRSPMVSDLNGRAATDLATLKSKYEEAKKRTKQAQEAKIKAENELESANKNLGSAKTNLAAAKKDKEEADKNAGQSGDSTQIAQAQKRYDDAVAKYNLGSAGFFKDLADQGDTDARLAYNIITAKNNVLQDGALKDTDYSGFTNLGAVHDATNLENMKKAIDELDQVNVYRQNENTTEGTHLIDLKVSSSAMAISQYQLNYSKDHTGHSQAFNIGENLAWGYSNPFIGWYDEEKEIFKNGGSGVTGHYLNIVNENYTVMGYSYISGSRALYNHTYGQTFTFDGSKYGTNAVSVAAYKGKFNTYYNAVKQEIADAKTALDEANAASGPKTPEQVAAEEKLALAQQAYNAALQAVTQAEVTANVKKAEYEVAVANEAALKKALALVNGGSNVETDTNQPSNATKPSTPTVDNNVNQKETENKKMAGLVNTGIEINLGGYIITMAIAGAALVTSAKKQKKYASK